MRLKRSLAILLCSVLVICSFAGCTMYKETPLPTGKAELETITVPTGSGEVTAATVPVSSTAAAVATTAENTSAAVTSATASTTGSVSVKVGTTVKGAAASTKAAKDGKDKKTTATTEPVPQYIEIVLLKNRKAKCSSPNVSLALGEVVIEKPGDYRITQNTKGKPWYGQIVLKLKNTEKAELRFENVNIQNNTPNIIQIIDKSIKTNRSFLETEGSAGTTADDEIKEVSDFDQAPNVQISFPEKTSSTFITTANSITGVLYNESKLIIKGHGIANFKSEKNANNCICSTKSIKIRNLTLNLTTAQNGSTSTLASTTGAARGIFSYSGVTLESGCLNVKTNGDAIRCDDFEAQGGTAVLTSSACDAIDADDAIVINGGVITATALEKACFKVRRINNKEKGLTKGIPRQGKGDTFAINGGTVRGEGKRITTVQTASKQPVITCKIVKPNRGTDAAKAESKVASVIEIKGLKKSSNKCTKFVYSSSGVKKDKKYTAAANGKTAESKWSGNTAVIDIESTKNR